MTRTIGAVVALLAACSSTPPRSAPPAAPDPSGRADAAPATGTPPAVGEGSPALRALEQRMLAAARVSLEVAIHAEGPFPADVEGSIELEAGNKAHLRFTGTFGGEPLDLDFASDGTTATTGPTPPALNEAIVIGLVRMGALHNVAVLSTGKPPDRSDGGAAEWLHAAESMDVTMSGVRRIAYTLHVAGQPMGEVRFDLDAATSLPRRREATVHFEDGDMTVTETFRDVVIE